MLVFRDVKVQREFSAILTNAPLQFTINIVRIVVPRNHKQGMAESDIRRESYGGKGRTTGTSAVPYRGLVETSESLISFSANHEFD